MLPPSHALLVTADPVLAEDVRRLAAVAGAEVHVEPQVAQVAAAWAGAALVVVGRDLAARVAAAGLPRRGRVVVVTPAAADAGVWQRAVEVGASNVVELPEGERWLVEALGDVADGVRGPAPVVSVVGGRGGAGASVFAAALATAGVAAGHEVTLLDADPLGGGIDLLFGGEETPGLRWADVAGARGRVAAQSLRAALPVLSGVAVLSWGRVLGGGGELGHSQAVPPEAMRSVLAAARRGAGLVVLDAPRQVDPAAEVALAMTDLAVLVVPAEVRATAAAARVAATVSTHCQDVRVVVRVPGPARLEPDAVAAALGLPLAGVLVTDVGLAEAIERGQPPTPGRGNVSTVATHLLERVLSAPRAAA